MLAEIAQSSTGPTIFHLRHPRPVSWSDVIHNFSSALKVPVASCQSWLSKLIEAAQSPDSEQTRFIVHAVKLLPIWKSIAAQAMEKGSLVPDSMGIGILLDIEYSARSSPAFLYASRLDMDQCCLSLNVEYHLTSFRLVTEKRLSGCQGGD